MSDEVKVQNPTGTPLRKKLATLGQVKDALDKRDKKISSLKEDLENLISPNRSFNALQTKATVYKLKLYKNHTYLFTSNYSVNNSLILRGNGVENLTIWDNTKKPRASLTLGSDYDEVYIWQNEDAEKPLATNILDITGTENKLNCEWVSGDFTDDRTFISEARVKTACTIEHSLPGLYLVTFPSDMKVKFSYHNNVTGTDYNMILEHPFSYKNYDKGIYCGVFNSDGSPIDITSPLLDEFKMYRVANDSEYDVVVGASDTSDTDKAKCDIVCDGKNDTQILASLFGNLEGIKALLMDGTYTINDAYSVNGIQCALPMQVSKIDNENGRRYVSIMGQKPCRPQSAHSVKLVVSEKLHNMLSGTEASYIIGFPYRINDRVQRSYTVPVLSNFNVIGYKYDKPITYIDLTAATNSMVDSVNVRSWYKDIGLYLPFDDTPNIECTGIRVGRGSDYGIQNFVKHSNYWYCGKGVACNGEHFIFEDVKTHHDYVGFVFGDRKTVGKYQHPNVAIGCSIEGCYRLMTLSKNGITKEEDFTPDDNNSISTLIWIGGSTEDSWDIPINERNGKTSQVTLPILEITKGAYRGRIEMDFSDKWATNRMVENGSCELMQLINTAVTRRGPLSQRPHYETLQHGTPYYVNEDGYYYYLYATKNGWAKADGVLIN